MRNAPGCQVNLVALLASAHLNTKAVRAASVSAYWFTVCACGYVCGRGEHMNNGCSHKLIDGQIRGDNVNTELLLVRLSGRR